MDLLRSGNKKDGDSISDFLFCKIVREKFAVRSDAVDSEEIEFVRLLIIRIRAAALKARTKYRRGTYHYCKLSNIISHMTVLLSEPIFKISSFQNALKNKNLIFQRNKNVLQLYNLSNAICESLIAYEYISDCKDYIEYALQWSEEDVLIGSLRNREQLNVCLEKKFYHVPVSQIEENKIPVRFVAIYQSKNLFGNYSGINYWGKIVKTEVVARNTITEIPSLSEAKYFKFTVAEWYKLDYPITSTSGGVLFGYTNLYKLLRAREIYQLYFSNYDEYKFYRAIKQAIDEHYNHVVYKYLNSDVFIQDEVLMIYFDKKEYFRISLREYTNNPGYHFSRICKVYESQRKK
ncbi:MAG: hypothetical protein II998_05990 [Clostridia bacterium]|nr:hypothetical protein [Clostridia bacterium]